MNQRQKAIQHALHNERVDDELPRDMKLGNLVKEIPTSCCFTIFKFENGNRFLIDAEIKQYVKQYKSK